MRIEIKGIDAAIRNVNNIAAKARTNAQNALDSFIEKARSTSVSLVPVNEGQLKLSIQADKKPLEVSLVATKNYAAYVEFGTRKYAAAYVATLPPDWQAYAATFKGPGGGTFQELINNLMEWVRHKGLGSGFGGRIGVTGTYSVKTRKRTGGKSQQERENEQAAYLIARSILIKGVRAQPFLYPAIRFHLIELRKNLKDIF